MRRFLCWLGFHKWSYSSGTCMACGYHEDLYDWDWRR